MYLELQRQQLNKHIWNGLRAHLFRNTEPESCNNTEREEEEEYGWFIINWPETTSTNIRVWEIGQQLSRHTIKKAVLGGLGDGACMSFETHTTTHFTTQLICPNHHSDWERDRFRVEDVPSSSSFLRPFYSALKGAPAHSMHFASLYFFLSSQLYAST